MISVYQDGSYYDNDGLLETCMKINNEKVQYFK